MAPPRKPRVPPALMEELIGEILLRVPPDEPAHLVRASLVCKPWLRLLSDPTFRRRYREFHRTPPLLGFLHNILYVDTSSDGDSLSPDEYRSRIPRRFVPTTKASPLTTPALGCISWWVLDCRHGRVLIHTFDPMGALFVWDPITGDQKQVPLPEDPLTCFTAAVLCAVAGCDHLDCRDGPFLVVFVGTEDETRTSVYSSETSTWTASSTIDLDSYVEVIPSHLTGDALYFMLEFGILKFDLREQSLTFVDPPMIYKQSRIVMTAEDGALGYAGIEGKSLYLWSRKNVNEDVAGWALCSVIELDGLIPIRNVWPLPEVIGFVEGTRTIFISTDTSVFTLDLKSMKVRKVGEKGAYLAVIPYTSFYAPVHRES